MGALKVGLVTANRSEFLDDVLVRPCNILQLSLIPIYIPKVSVLRANFSGEINVCSTQSSPNARLWRQCRQMERPLGQDCRG